MNRDKTANSSPVLAAEKRELLAQLLGEENAPTVKPISRRGTTPAPLSFAQQRLWFLNEMTPETGAAYNNSLGTRIAGKLDAGALERALNEIVARHEALRTTFRVVGDVPMQVVSPTLNIKLKVIDVTALPEADRDSELRRIHDAEERTPFDLSQGPLLRALLVRLGPEEHAFILYIHHIVSDGWTTGVIQNELFTLYEAFCAGRSSPLAELPIQYADYCWWQRDFLQGEALQQQLEYWRKNMQGAPAALDLPTDRPRLAVQGVQGGFLTSIWPAEFSSALKAFSRREGVTLFMTLLSAFEVLLARYSGQRDLAIGTPIAGRTRVETEPLVGLFLNTLPLRANLSGDPTVRQVLQGARETSLQAYANQDVPFEKLVEELQPERDLSRSPLFQVMFILHNAPFRIQTASGLTFGPLDLTTHFSKFDLTMIGLEYGDELRIGLEFNTELFDSSTIERMGQHLRNLLAAMMENPEAKVFELPLMQESERRTILTDWNDSARSWSVPQCFPKLFEARAERAPERTAVRFNGAGLSYADLNARANQLADFLRAAGVGPDVLVAVSLERSIEMLVATLAVMKAGGAYVPLDPEYPLGRIAFMLEDSGAKILLTQESLLGRSPAHGKTICIDRDWAAIAERPSANPAHDVKPSDLAYVIYTSGSTGKPKGVMIPHSALANFLLSMREAPGITESDVLLAVTTLSFDIAGLELYLPLIAGAAVEIASRETAGDPIRLGELIVQGGATMMQATPATWRMLIESGWKGHAGLKALCGGEGFPRDLANHLLARCGSVWNMYGPTETTIWSSISKVEAGDAVVPIGRPIANTQLYVLDERLQPVPPGLTGELYIGGAGLAVGYLNRPELTAERFVTDPFAGSDARMYRTGDQARYRADGAVECLGRADSQVKVRGYRIELEEIENNLAEYPGVRQAVVAAREDGPGDKRLVAYVIPAQQPAPQAAELRAHLGNRLPQYMVPSAFVVLEKFPLTPNGKVDRRALPAPDRSRADAETAYVAPRTIFEQNLAAIWAEALNLTTIGVNDNFFDLGGHSLLLTRVRNEIERRMGVSVPIIELFRYPTIEALSKFMGNAQSEAPALPQVQDRAELRRRSIQRRIGARPGSSQTAAGDD